ncbi:DNA-binding transcriptional regulator, MarR family [Shimia marina]|uniref:MarR family protein n=2 Tax=Shimia marina TaxID=321267 RepID=A0A0P1ESG2_9RHOB|nr:MarR family transcriptional regulator [Shimia marina]CUH53277.1 MarR family protein [Shimia marina]SFD80930.1 DNA-binding transcriptional regulator, MarR family [Shimia marina]
MIDKKDGAFLGQNIKGIMMTLIARWNGQMDAARANTEFADVRPADMRLFAQLRGRTVRLSEIHREMGFSRQAAQQAVERLIRHDMVAVAVDPNSKRDKIVSITAKGQRWRSIAAEQIRLIETEISETLGEAGKEELRRSLLSLAAL